MYIDSSSRPPPRLRRNSAAVSRCADARRYLRISFSSTASPIIAIDRRFPERTWTTGDRRSVDRPAGGPLGGPADVDGRLGPGATGILGMDRRGEGFGVVGPDQVDRAARP